MPPCAAEEDENIKCLDIDFAAGLLLTLLVQRYVVTNVLGILSRSNPGVRCWWAQVQVETRQE